MRQLRRAVRKLRYWGLRHKCPFCGSRLRCFLPFGLDFPVLQELRVVGAGRRANGLCPICFSSDRERLLILLMQQQPELFGQAMSVLHVAPERHVREVLLRRRPRRYVTADLSSRDVKVRLDITRLPFPDASFDLVLCNHVLEHVQEDTKAMRELLRVLTPGGRSIPQVPIGLALDHTREDPAITDPRDRERLFGQEDHVRIYGPDYPARLEKAGFTVEVVSPRALLGARQVEDCGASPDEEVFLCSKQL